jgi:hypothetical protein
MLVAAYRLRREDYRHPWWLYLFGVIVVITTAWFSIQAMV